MAGNGLTFKLFGEDVSASSALEGVQVKAGDVAKGIAAGFAAVKIGEALTQGFDNEKILDVFRAGLGQTPEVAAMAGTVAGDLFKQGIGAGLDETTAAVGAVGTSMVDLGATAPADLARITTSAIAVAAVMGTDVTEVTRAAGQMFANGLAPSAEAALDIIATGAGNGANASGDLLDTLTEYGAPLAALGLDGATATAMLSAGLDAGIVSTDKAADAFNEFGIRAIDGSKTTGDAYAALGLDAGKMAADIAAGGPAAEAATGTIMSALGNMTDPIAQEAAGVALFGSMWEDSGSKAILAMNPVTQEMGNVAGAATSMANEVNDNAATKIDGISRTFDGWLQSAVELPGPLGTIVGSAMAIGPTAISMGASVVTAAAALSNMGIVTKIVAAGQWLLNAAMSANPIGLIIIAVIALVAGFIWLWNNVEGFRAFFIAAWEMIRAALSAVWDWITGAVYAVGQAIVGAFTTAVDFVKGAFQSVLDFLSGAWDWITAAVYNVGQAIVGAFSAAVEWVKGAFQSVLDFLSGIWNGITGAVQALGEGIRSAFNGAVEFVKSIFSGLGNFFSGVWEGVKSAVGSVGQWIQDKFQAAVDFVIGIFGGIGGALSGAFSGVAGFIKGGINTAIDAVNWVIRQLNKINFTLPGWIPLVGGNSFGINISEIPRLAEGGIAMPQRGGFPAIVGDGRGPELIAPLSALGNLGGSGTTVVINVTGAVVGSQDALARAVVDAMASAARRGAIPRKALA